MPNISSNRIGLPTEIVGYVEGSSNDEVVGWAWKKGERDRLRVELRSGQESVSSTLADGHRVDLRLNGVGDGCHGFRLAVPSDLRNVSADLAVFAIDHDGHETLLSQPPAAMPSEGGDADVRRNLELLVGSQRVIHRNLQAALLNKGPSLSEGIAQISATQIRLGETLATLELFTIRVEDLLQSQLQPRVIATGSSLVKFCAAFACLACLLSCFALWRVLVLT